MIGCRAAVVRTKDMELSAMNKELSAISFAAGFRPYPGQEATARDLIPFGFHFRSW